MIGTILLLIVSSSPLGGFLRFEDYIRVDSIRQHQKIATTYQLKVSLESGDVEGFGAFNIVYDIVKKTTSLEPIEGYLSWERGDIGLTLGKRIVSIGTADWLNPTDVITPRDYTSLHSDLEEFRKGVEEVNLDVNFSQMLVSFYVFPGFTPNRYPMRTIFIPLGPAGAVEFNPDSAELPTTELKNTQFGFRVHGFLSNVDFSFTYLRIFDRDPDLKAYTINQQPGNFLIRIVPFYNWIHMVGSDFSATIGSWEVHGEGAYFKTVDEDGEDPGIKNSFVYAVAGGNRTFFDEKVRFGIQAGIKHIFNFRDSTYFANDMVKSFLNSFARRTYYETEENVYYGTLTLGYNSQEGNWSVDGTLVYDFTNSDYFSIPKFMYSPADGVNFIAGLFLSGGKGSSPFSEMGKHVGKLAFFEVKYSF